MQGIPTTVADDESADVVGGDEEITPSGPRLRLAALLGLSRKQSNALVLKELARNGSRPAVRLNGPAHSLQSRL
jgi:hypothetical protein